MPLILKQATIIDPSSPHHQAVKDIVVKKGIITSIRQRISNKKGKEVDCSGWSISPGFLDIGAYCGEPGEEHVETYQSLSRRAIQGGFTSVATLPNTNPLVQTASDIRYLSSVAEKLPIHIRPLGSVTRDGKGKALAEIIDMKKAGAVAFTDGFKSIANVGMMNRSLEYAKASKTLIINRPQHEDLKVGSMHEGSISVRLGLTGIPRLSEIMMLKRDLDLLRYTQSCLLVHCISCAESVELIREAKKEGLKVFCSVASLNLYATDEALHDFDVNYKVLPPLREEIDRQALIAGVVDGTIDLVCSNHRPHAEEQKKVEFPYAGFGALGLETAFHFVLSALGRRRKSDTLVQALAIRPRKLLGLPDVMIENGAIAELTLFRTDVSTDTKQLFKKGFRATNNPVNDAILPGRIGGIVNKNGFHASDAFTEGT